MGVHDDAIATIGVSIQNKSRAGIFSRDVSLLAPRNEGTCIVGTVSCEVGTEEGLVSVGRVLRVDARLVDEIRMSWRVQMLRYDDCLMKFVDEGRETSSLGWHRFAIPIWREQGVDVSTRPEANGPASAGIHRVDMLHLRQICLVFHIRPTSVPVGCIVGARPIEGNRLYMYEGREVNVK